MDNQTTERRPTRRKKKNWLPFIALFLCGYVFVQIYLMNANGVDTVKAQEGYINDSIISQGIVCREENVLVQNTGGVVDYLTENGERVSKGNIIAMAYPAYSDIEKLIKLRFTQHNLDEVNTAGNYIDGGILDMSQTRKQLTNQLSTIAAHSQKDDYISVIEDVNRLTFSLNKISVATGRTTDFSQAVTQLESEINGLKSGVSQPLATFSSPYAGYFIQSTDGYETIATVENFLSYTYEQGSEIINSQTLYQPAVNEYGKIITDYKWSLCTYVDKALTENIYKGRTLNISIDINSNVFNKAVVKEVVELGDKALVILECTVMDKTAAAARVTDCEILFKQYNGIKIPKSAIHFIDGQMGVYVNFSNVVYFKKITPVFEDDNYIIVPKTTDENNEVKLYDSIIVKGRNLYDGKYL
ncbi:MAG: hypothetical protein IKY30_05455 [Oscillospiraceae bacterium]|nr:hypothetical protein [Oscillospiraceae bacterium]